MAQMMVTVPAGVAPGQPFQVNANGQAREGRYKGDITPTATTLALPHPLTHLARLCAGAHRPVPARRHARPADPRASAAAADAGRAHGGSSLTLTLTLTLTLALTLTITSSCAHAYVLSRRGYRRLLRLLPR